MEMMLLMEYVEHEKESVMAFMNTETRVSKGLPGGIISFPDLASWRARLHPIVYFLWISSYSKPVYYDQISNLLTIHHQGYDFLTLHVSILRELNY